MCRRFTLAKTADQVANDFPELDVIPQIAPRYNIAPVQPVVTVLNIRPKNMDLTQWGLIPGWAEDATRGHAMINTFSDKLRDNKPGLRRLLKRKRCLILADGWYTWASVKGQKVKQPYYVTLESGRTFAFAGLFDEWHDKEGGYLITSSILTTRPNVAVRTIAETMPVVLSDAQMSHWVDPWFDDQRWLLNALAPCDPDLLRVTGVSTYVNSLRHDDPKCIHPMDVLGQGELF